MYCTEAGSNAQCVLGSTLLIRMPLFAVCRLQDALHDFSCAIAVEENAALSYSSRALLLERLGRPDQALMDHDKAVQLEPANVVYVKNRGLCCRTLGHYQQALQDFTR